MADLVTKLGEQAGQEANSPPRFRLSMLVIFGFVFSSLGLLGWGLGQVNSEQVDYGMAPDLTITSFAGETFTLSDLRGQGVIINFWASWCPPSRVEAPCLEAAWRNVGAIRATKGVNFLALHGMDLTISGYSQAQDILAQAEAA